MQDFVDAVSAEVANIFGSSEDDALASLQAAADLVGSGATLAYGTQPNPITGEGTIIITYKGATSDPIDVDIIA